MSDAIENTTGSADSNDKTKLIGRESDVVPGLGEPLQITHVQYSRGGGNTAPKRPLFLCLHGWGSNETDLADMMRYVAPYNDFASLRAPLTLQPAGRFAPGAYSWLHDCVDTGEDLDRDAFAAAKAIDDWVSANIPDDRAVVPIVFAGRSAGDSLAARAPGTLRGDDFVVRFSCARHCCGNRAGGRSRG